MNIDVMHSLVKHSIYNLRIVFALPDTHIDFVVLVKKFLSG